MNKFEGHTPGPWSWFNAWNIAPGEVACLRLGSDQEAVARPTDHGGDIRLRNPDAELIAAAPDLLAQNERLVDACNGLLGLLQLLAARPDITGELRKHLTSGHRIDDARALLAEIEASR